MPTVLQFRRGTTSQNNSFTGSPGELSIDTDLDVIRVHDGSQPGGFAQVGLNCVQTIANKIYLGTSLSVTGNVTGGNITPDGNIVLSDTKSISIGSLTITDDTIRSTEHTITIGSLGNIGNVIIGGNLTVNGNTTTFNSNVVTTNDLVYTLANNAASSTQANGGGIEVGPVGSPFITFLYNNTSNNWVSSGGLALTGNIVNNGANGTGNIGNSSTYFNTVFAKATSAQYADLAEMYCADADYAPGTVIEFGGTAEVTATTESHSTRVAGIISTNPSYLMNSTIACEINAVAVALTGRVPCQVVGSITKGDRLVSSGLHTGVATVLDMSQYQPGCIIGKALENYNSTEVGTIEVAVGRT
jgi:hypothetical protein